LPLAFVFPTGKSTGVGGRRNLLGQVIAPGRDERRRRHGQRNEERLRSTRLAARCRAARRLGRKRRLPLFTREPQSLRSTGIDLRALGIAERLPPHARQPVPGLLAFELILGRGGRVFERPGRLALVVPRQQTLHEQQPRFLVSRLEAHRLTQLVQRGLGIPR